MRTTRKIVAIVTPLILSLTACQTTQDALGIGDAATERNPGPCPRAFTLHDAQRYVEVAGKEVFANVGFTGEINNVRSLCRYYGENPIKADLTLDMDFGRGPNAQGNTKTYEYFVAVTRKNMAVIHKETFPITVTFPEGKDRISVREKVSEIIIPRASETTSGENFEIVTGFVVTEQQRDFNAQGKRFRVSAGQK